MRKRIQQLARGKFEYAKPLLRFSTDKIEIEVLEGKDYTGDFIITSANQVPLRGIVYTSDPRMECLTPQFEGEEVRIRYQFHSQGMAEGDIGKGEFFIICNQGEYNLSFVASISKLYAETSIGKIRTCEDFAQLAKKSLPEAVQLFYSPNFKNIIPDGETETRLLYEGLAQGAVMPQKVEEFLLGIGAKKRVTISVAQETVEFCDVTEVRRETLELQKEHWGVVTIHVSSDADFLVPSKNCLTEEDFIGSVCRFEYYIYPERMHGGRNYGTLRFEMPQGERSFLVTAGRTAGRDETKKNERRQIEEGRVRLMQLYMDYRLKKIVTGVWANRSSEILDHLAMVEPDEPMYQLMKAQAKIANKQRQEASWIMEDFKRKYTDHTSPEWGYYLYLCTLVEREPSYVDRVTEEIEGLFLRHPDSTLLFWILLFVRAGYYRNSAMKLKEIEHWVMHGNKSPYLYLEAYYLFWQDPYLLNHLGQFEIEVLNWARKQETISKDVAMQVMHAVSGEREFLPVVYRILEACYQVLPKEEMLAAVCGYLIKGGCFDVRYHEWYALAIENEIRITGIYEAYLMSMDMRQVGNVPKMIQMYFQYNNALSYEQRAVLYVNIIAGKAKQPDVYQKYRRSMEQFAMEQIESGHISDNLAVLYDEMLKIGILSEELSHRLSQILFTHKLTCDNPNVARAFIYEYAMSVPAVVSLAGGVAYFTVYTRDYRIVLENNRGEFLCGSENYHEEALMHPGRYLKQCMELTPDEVPYLLGYFDERQSLTDFVPKEEGYFKKLLQSAQVSGRYKAALIPGVAAYYQNREDAFLHNEMFLEQYLSQSGAKTLQNAVRRRLIELLAESHMYEKAYELVQLFGYDYLGNTARVALCSYAITEAGFEEDDFLVGFAQSTFLKGKYNDVILIYLCKYAGSATKVLAEIWKAAGEFEIDTFDLEERILTQMLYTTEYTPYAEQIYENYYAGGGRELVCMAYLSYFAHSYFTGDAVVPEHVFLQIKERYLEGQELNEACRLGLLKHLAYQGNLKEQEIHIADELLDEYLGANIYFAFYRRFPRKLLLKYQLYDKYFLEYHGKPDAHIVAYYRMGDNAYESEELTEMYNGIYVREFILFFGEEVQYYITENGTAKDKVVESGCITNNDVAGTESGGRYARMNDILLQMTLQDGEQLAHQMKNYYGMRRVTEEVFKLL